MTMQARASQMRRARGSCPPLRALALALILLPCPGESRALRSRQRLSIQGKLGRDVEAAPGKSVAKVNATRLALLALGWQTVERPGHDGTTFREAVQRSAESMDVSNAMQHLRRMHQLPADMVALFHVGGQVGSKSQAAGFDEESIQKARLYLNGLLAQAYSELDDAIIQCKEYQEESQGALEQTSEDLSSLGEQVANLMRLHGEANEGINVMHQDVRQAHEEMRREEKTHADRKLALESELLDHEDKARALWVLLTQNNCSAAASGGAALLEEGRRTSSIGDAGRGPGATGVRVCASGRGRGREIHVCDPATARSLRRLLSRAAAGAGRPAPASLLELALADDDVTTSAPANVSTTNVTAVVSTTTPPLGVEPPREQAPIKYTSQCVCRSPEGYGGDCKVLQKSLAVEWAAAQDDIARVQQLLQQSDDRWDGFRQHLNLQLQVMTEASQVYSEQLDEATAKLSTERERLKQKEEEHRDLKHEQESFLGKCRATVERIVQQDVCSLMSVRAALLKDSTQTPADDLTDCEVADWSPQECSKSCDDACGAGSQECGGVQTLTRQIVEAGQWGVACPALQRRRRCNQVKCPVDCVLSEWSGFSACTKECEGGVQGRTRGILAKAKHGGLVCNNVQEERPCNTDSCDQDCVLGDWTAWSTCSSGCGGGSQETRRAVLTPIRGNGRCPMADSRERLWRQSCNAQACEADPSCAAVQDLAVLVDSSGLSTQEEFDVMRSFVKKLVGRFKAKYYGAEAMRVGLIQYGNGEVLADGSVTTPKVVLPLGPDLDVAGKLVPSFDGLEPTTGFSNLAQALSAARRMFQSGGRATAQSAVLVITSGAPAFVYQTNFQVDEMEQEHVLRYVVPIVHQDEGEEDIRKLADWASSPSAAFTVQVPGTAALKQDESAWVVKVLSKTCAHLVSSTAKHKAAEAQGFTLVAPASTCVDSGAMQLLSRSADATHCASLASEAGAQIFQVGRSVRQGYCYGSSPFLSNMSGMAVTTECQPYAGTQCLTTLDKSCPGQRLGKSGAAADDGSAQYACCCQGQMWRSMCSKFTADTGCSWTAETACPGQAEGSSGFATDDGSDRYKCCCELGLWQDPVALWGSWLSGAESPACPAPMAGQTKLTQNRLWDVYGVKPQS